MRATWWNLAVGLLLTVAFAAMVGASADASAKKGVDVTMPAPHHASQAFLISQLTIVVLATLALTSEYSSGSIRTTLQSVPARGRMLRSKTLVVAAVVVASGFVFSLLGTLVAAPLMGDYGDYSSGQLFGTALGAGVYLALLAVMAIGLGTVLRSAAGTITTLIMVLLALPQLMGVVGAKWLETASDYMPSVAGTVLLTQDSDPYAPAPHCWSSCCGPWPPTPPAPRCCAAATPDPPLVRAPQGEPGACSGCRSTAPSSIPVR